MTQATKTRKPVEIKSAVVFRCYAKEDTNKERCLGYLVPSDTEGTDPYRVTFNYEAHRYECNCKCGIESNHTVTCKHIRAVNSTVAARHEFHKQEITSPATTEPVETHRIARVRGAGGMAWYPEYFEDGTWYRFPLEGTTHAVSFFDEAPAKAWLADRLAAIAEQAAERKMDAFKRGMDEQYASDPRRGLSLGEIETAQSEMRHFYDEY